jgi:hypothetical protein
MKMTLSKEIIIQILLDHIADNYDVKVKNYNLTASDSSGSLGDHVDIDFEIFGEKQ